MTAPAPNDLLTQLIECNQWRFIGRLAADPEMKYFGSGASVCNARLLVNRPGQKRDDGQKPYGFKLKLWNDKAQSFADVARKGDLVNVNGQVETETWTDRNTGEERRGVVVNVEAFELMAKPGRGQQAAPPAARPAAPAAASTWGTAPLGSQPKDDEIPF
ncbi:MAG: single-stranded DNA-binding protein [Cyanobium sp. 49614_E6]|jgi:single-strand DNA-binding protein|nr:single-stranded DNA-binding protein [Cyanobium sp. 49614_E6]